jgi:heme/copper-type cytochrome/quinol oxidase subunit 1
MKHAMTVAAFLAVLATPALAAETVQSLLAQDYAVVGTTSPAGGGAGLLLQKKDKLFFCFVAETPNSPTVATRYCKPVQ